jgi:hypothetical protein
MIQRICSVENPLFWYDAANVAEADSSLPTADYGRMQRFRAGSWISNRFRNVTARLIEKTFRKPRSIPSLITEIIA